MLWVWAKYWKFEKLEKKGKIIVNRCWMCKNCSETGDNLFFTLHYGLWIVVISLHFIWSALGDATAARCDGFVCILERGIDHNEKVRFKG